MGCSADDVEAQTKFKIKHKLNFPLLADTEFEVIEPFGARRMKSFLGSISMGKGVVGVRNEIVPEYEQP